MDRFLSMQAFVRVAETRSFVQAARRLGVSRSVVSDRVRQLEALLRSPLLHRTTRIVRLSETGERLFPEYLALVNRIDDLENRASHEPASLQGRLRILSVVDFGVTYLAPMLAEFGRIHPELSIELIVDNHVMNPTENGFDVAVHLRQADGADLLIRDLLTISSVYCAAPAYLSAAEPILDPSDLRRHACINYSFQPNLNEWTFLRESEIRQLHAPWRMASNNGQIIRLWALEGLGVAVLPQIRIHDDLEAGRLVRVVPDWSPPQLRLTATLARASAGTRRVSTLLAFLSDRLGRLTAR